MKSKPNEFEEEAINDPKPKSLLLIARYELLVATHVVHISNLLIR